MKTTGKTILTALLVGVLMSFTGFLVSFLLQMALPTIQQEYANPALFRSWSDPPMMLFFIAPLASGLIMTLIWQKAAHAFSDSAIEFGFFYWLIGFPGMIMSYSTFPVSMVLVLTWTLSGLCETLVGAKLLSLMLRKTHTAVL